MVGCSFPPLRGSRCDSTGTEVARSKQGSFLSDTFMVFNTDPSAAADEGEGEEGAEASPKGPEPLAYARLSKGSKIRGQFCALICAALLPIA